MENAENLMPSEMSINSWFNGLRIVIDMSVIIFAAGARCALWMLVPLSGHTLHLSSMWWMHSAEITEGFHLADNHLPTLVSVPFCPIDGARCHFSEPEVCPLIDKWHLGCSDLCWSASTCEKPAGQAGAFTMFMMPFTRMERGSSEAIWVTGNETGFREICTADTPATEVLLTHVRTRKHKYTAILAHSQTGQPPFRHVGWLYGCYW